MTPLEALARDAGIAVSWTGADRRQRRVAPQTLRAILKALGLPADNPGAIIDSRAQLKARQREQPLTVVRQGGVFAAPGRQVRLLAEDGGAHELRGLEGAVTADLPPGYYRIADSARTLAVTPRRAFQAAGKMWGIAAQLYALRGSPGFGDFAALGRLCEDAAKAGADAVMLSPVHALLPGGISPYSPSSRQFLNPLYIPCAGRDPGNALIDWPRATRHRLETLRRAFRQFEAMGGDRAFESFVRNGGSALRRHARMQADDASDTRFQLYLQWRADAALAQAQARARAAGMAIGLISDVAVGVDPRGSEADGNSGMLHGLCIGAPPDAFNSGGQNWGLTGFSPEGLRSGGYRGFLDMLRAAMRHAGGIRLDHAMGLMRLWVVPDGMRPAEGAYLHYPFESLLGLLCLESQRHRALVIAEDLGTVPPVFRHRIHRAGLLGMNVLWFARDAQGAFVPPCLWPASNAALSGTHDLPTLAGWWRERDLAWRAKITGQPQARARKERAREKRALWKALKRSGAGGTLPGSAGRFIDGAMAALATAPSPLTLVPLEDLTGEIEQANIPGTIDEHPNWRRRLAADAPFALRAVRRRAALLGRRP